MKNTKSAEPDRPTRRTETIRWQLALVVLNAIVNAGADHLLRWLASMWS